MRVNAVASVHQGNSALSAPVQQPLAAQVMRSLSPRVRNPNKKTPDDVWEEMKKNFEASKAKGVHLTFQWKLSGKNGGEWFIVIEDGKFTVNKGTADKANVTFLCSAETWVALSNEKLSGTVAFLSGRLQVKGSHSTAKKLDTIFPA